MKFFAFGEDFPNFHASYVHIPGKMKALAELGNDVEIFARPPKDEKHLIGKYLERKNDYSIKYVIFPKVSNFISFGSYMKSLKIVRDDIRGSDIIHERFYPELFSTAIIKNSGMPSVLELNNPVAEELNNPLLRFSVKLIRKLKTSNCDAIITQTQTLKSIISRFTKKPIYVVPNGVDVKKYSKKSSWLRGRYGISKKDIVITFVGAYRPWHGINQMPSIVEAFTNENIKFVFIGGHSDFLSRYRNVIQTKHLAYDDVAQALLSSDILIAPFDTGSYKYLEKLGFWWCPVKLFEYAAAGKPVVSYNYKEVRNIVKDAALLAKPGNRNEFIENLSSLIENRSLRKKLGNRGKRYSRKYDWAYVAKSTLDVYENIT